MFLKMILKDFAWISTSIRRRIQGLPGLIILKDERGFSLFEVLVSVALLSILGTTFLVGLSTGLKALAITDQRQIARNLAETQLEYIKGLPYAPSYTPASIPDEYAVFSVVTEPDGMIYGQPIQGRDSYIQKIEVIVQNQSKEIMTITGYKVRR